MKPAIISEIKQVATLIQQGIDAWEQAGAIIVRLIDSGTSIDEIHDQMNGSIPTGALESFERIGRRQVVPSLLIADYPAASHLMKLSIDQQESLLSNGCSLMILNESGPNVLKCSVRDLTGDQCRQLFNGNGVRSPGQQRTWIESNREKRATAKLALKAADEPYIIRRGKVLFNKTCELTRQQLAMLLAQMEGA